MPRSAWGADESIRRAEPSYGPTIRFASVHHTAGTNAYSPSQAAAIMRGIEVYHVKSNGWNDIGYNFLVDRYGTVYEGRYGGIDKNVIGAYARGFNTGSLGVAVIGTFGTSQIPAAAEASLEKLLAWRLDLAHVDPVSTLTFVSGGSERYNAGVPVVLRAVSGHRDTGLTSCPGNLLYARLDTIAAKTEAIGLPKLYEPKVTGGRRRDGPVPGAGLLGAALEGAHQRRPRAAARQGTGQGPTVDYSWDASLVTAAGVRWRIEVAGATPVTGTLGKSVGHGPLAITDLPPIPRRSARTVTASETPPRSRTRRMRPRPSPQRSSTRPGLSWRRSARRRASRPGAHSRRSTVSVSPTASTRSCSRRSTPTGVSVTSQLQIAITRTLWARTQARGADAERRRHARTRSR